MNTFQADADFKPLYLNGTSLSFADSRWRRTDLIDEGWHRKNSWQGERKRNWLKILVMFLLVVFVFFFHFYVFLLEFLIILKFLCCISILFLSFYFAFQSFIRKWLKIFLWRRISLFYLYVRPKSSTSSKRYQCVFEYRLNIGSRFANDEKIK